MNSYLPLIIQRFGKDYIEAGMDSRKPHVRYNCPFCAKKRGKEDTDRKLYCNVLNGSFYCFKCHSSGWLRKSVSVAGSSVYSKLFGIFDRKSNDDHQEEPNMFYIPNVKIKENTVAFDYLLKRGIDQELIEYYNIRLGIGREFGRVVIPNELYGVNNDFTDMFSARSYLNQEPRYLNPDGCKKSHSVFNINNIENGGVIKIVEGVITSICAGKNSVGVYGSSPSKDQLEKIIDKNPEVTYCVLDSDAYKKNEELADKLISMGISGKVYIVYMPKGIDAADMGEKEFNKYIEENRIAYNKGTYRSLVSYVKRKEMY